MSKKKEQQEMGYATPPRDVFLSLGETGASCSHAQMLTQPSFAILVMRAQIETQSLLISKTMMLCYVRHSSSAAHFSVDR